MYGGYVHKLIGALAVLFVLAPMAALAAEYRTGETRAAVPVGTTIADDLYIASGEVDIDGTVDGDVVAAGGTIRINGNIKGDLAIAGGDVIITGSVADDLRVAGGNVFVGGTVGDDLLVLGGSVEITEEASVEGDVRAGAGALKIEGKTGAVTVGVGALTVTSTARINGDLRYTSEDEATIESGATITGSTVRGQSTRTWLERVSLVGGIFPFVTLLMALLFLYVLPNKAARLATDWRKQFWGNLLWGFLFMIAAPIAIFLLFVSIVGAPLGMGVALIFPIMMYVGYLSAALGVGMWLKNFMDREREPKPNWLAVILGVAVMAVLGLIPYVGWIIGGIVYLAGLGALVRFDWDTIVKLRSAKTL